MPAKSHFPSMETADIPEAPTFYPTMAEFNNFRAYIEKV